MKQKLIIYLFLFVIFGCKNSQEKRVYLIPEGYEGPLLIIEDEAAIEKPLKKTDSIIFDFTKSIVLKFKGKFIENSSFLSNIKYYYVDELGNKREIPFNIGGFGNIDSNQVYVYLKYSQIGENSQCDLITTPKNFLYYFQQQEKLCDSLLSKRPQSKN